MDTPTQDAPGQHAPRKNAGWVLAALVVGCQLVGILGALLFPTGNTAWYAALNKPSFQPPGWLFGPVWTALYAAMAVAAWLIWRTPDSKPRRCALRLFAVQLVLNGVWTPVFFGAHQLVGALVILAVLVIAVVVTIASFAKLDRRAAWLLAPYLAWICFALTLNATIVYLN